MPLPHPLLPPFTLKCNADMQKNTPTAFKWIDGFFLFFLIPAEKPSLQSRHSLDSSRVQDKEAGPLWITLALQKQKGFREQQQNREERRSLRETKLAEKHARDRESVIILNPDSLSDMAFACLPRPSLLSRNKHRPFVQVTQPSPTDGKESGSASPSSKPQTPEEPKRPDSLLGRFERREHLKKANTLPSSVTGKILH